jgi:hypothetical protein
MNERIRLLAEQATDIVEIVNPDTGITHHREFFDQEKFAELIVQECCSAIRLDDVFSGGKFQRIILEHFGVK